MNVYTRKLTTIEMINKNWDEIRIRADNRWKIVAERKFNKTKKDWIKSCDEEYLWSFSSLEGAISSFEEKWYNLCWDKTVKIRTTYELVTDEDGIVKFDFDQYLDLWWMKTPEFFEIEAKDEETVVKYVELLWFSRTDMKDWWPKKLTIYYRELADNLLNNRNNFQTYAIFLQLLLTQKQVKNAVKKKKS